MDKPAHLTWIKLASGGCTGQHWVGGELIWAESGASRAEVIRAWYRHCGYLQARECGRKRQYGDLREAKESAKRIRKRFQDRLNPYKCSFCNFFHLGH